MRVVNLLFLFMLAQLWLGPTMVVGQDDLDFDALFDIGVEEETEAQADTNDTATTTDSGQEEAMEEPDAAAEPEADAPEQPQDPADEMDMPADEPAAGMEPADESVPAEEPADDWADDEFDWDEDLEWEEAPTEGTPPTETAPATEAAVDEEPAAEQAPAEPTADRPTDEPAMDEPASQDDFDDFMFFEDEEPGEEPAMEEAPAAGEEAGTTMDEPSIEEEEVEPTEAEEETEPVADEGAEEMSPGLDLAAQEEIRRQAAEVEGLQSLDAAFRALEQEEYEAARDAFQSALDNIPVRPATEELRERATWGLAESHYRIAQEIYRDEGDLRVARQNLESALELSPGHRGLSLLQRRIARAEARRMAEEQRPVPVERRPEVAERRATTAEALAEARAYYDAGELARAEVMFENILVRDEYNTDAMRYLRRIAEDRLRIGQRMRDATSAQMMSDVRDAWSPPRRDVAPLPEELAGGGPTDLVTPSRQLQKRMEEIVIPRIEFRQANIRDVISFLRDASEAADPAGEGVNIILNMNMPDGGGQASAARRQREEPADDPWGTDDPWGDVDTASAPERVSGVPTITLSLRRISLMEAIRYITEVAGLRYRLEDSVVVITPAGVADVGRVVTRLYPVQPSFLDLVSEQQQDEPETGGFGQFQEFGERRPPSSGRTGDVKGFFEGAGVPFPVGTSITYNPTISQLIVANTPENLDKFERILSQLNVVPSQVEIEARFVEVAEEDMQELGLQWIFTDNYEFLQRRENGPIAGRERIQIDSGNVSRGTRFFGATESGTDPVSLALAAEAPTFAGNILSISSILTNPEMSVVLHALSQNGNVDLLSAPRVTTRSGVNASIEVVTEIIYPTEFRVTEPTITGASGDTGSAVISPPTVTPDSFETRRTGVILNVTPTVGPDGYTIDLALAPEVAELVDWIQYGSRIRVPNPIEPGNFQEFLFNIPQPVFASRNVQTSIVIWDGQTVVMGGLMRERLVTINDKIPILGDIPLLGRLFRNEGSQSRKENLLIFVTARLVDPAGKPIHRDDAVNVSPSGE